ncbi:MAG: hypothetical protein JSV36_05135 [Anaerolineae bacterium]|nr:MAG: hypothetical protein JSV36_05135 [Anaerolineae bacterium]
MLDFELVNLRVEKSEGDAPAKIVKQGSGQAYLVVTFPPQHLTEKAYFITTVPDFPVSTPGKTDKECAKPPDPDESSGDKPPEPPPIQALLSGWSRLVFRVPNERLPLQWTLDELLNVMGEFELSVPANALPPKELRVQLRDLFVSALAKAKLVEPGILDEIGILPGAFSSTRGASEMISAERITPGSASDPGTAVPSQRSRAATVQHVLTPRGGGQVIAVARARRKLRTLGNQFGAAGLTGADTLDIHEKLVDDLVALPIAPILLRPEPGPPTATQTALELPYHIILSPNRFGAWIHRKGPMTSEETGHTELWHTRLGVRRPDGTLIDGDDWRRTLRAVWTTDYPPPSTPAPSDPVDVPTHVNFPWRMSLDRFDRHNVVHLSSNFKLRDPNRPGAFFEPRPLDVDLLALTSLGAWLDSRGAWDTPLPQGLSVEEWRHRATLGRDHYVRVVYAGFLFPWGHRASLIKVTERQFHDDLPGDPAYLRQRMFLVVREPLKTYRNSRLTYQGPDDDRKGEQFDLMMPFEAVRITTRVSPLLDRPEDDDIAGLAQGCFWPNVGKQPFKVHLVATDTAGNQVDLAMPLIFVGKEETDKDHAASIVPDDVVQAYATDPWPGTSILRATVPVGGQRMALAESAAPDDTTFAAQTLTFGAEVPVEATYDKLEWWKPRFFPVVRSAEIDVPSLQSIARTSQPAGVVFAGVYLKESFSASNAGEVFLAKDPAAPNFGVTFSNQGDRSGGLITPDLSLSGLSRVTGPISGDLDTAAIGSFDPMEWFGALTGAKLFGVLALTDILDLVGFDELDKLPKFIGQSLNQVEQLIADIERLRTLLTTNPVPETATISNLLDQLLDPETGSIPALLEGGSVATVISQLSALDSELGSLQGTLMGSDLPPGPKALVSEAISTLQDGIDAVVAAAGLLQSFADGDLLPEALDARFEWRPEIKPWGPFKPSGTRNLVLAVQAAGEDFTALCSLDDFILDLVFVILDFERVQLRMRAGEKPEVDVKFTDFKFAGPLSFVETLREIIPFDGFSDPPDVEVTAEGITAGFSTGLPNLAVGVFSLENLSLAAGFSVPFLGPPLSTWFNFCERENPARLTVSLFGGGFFFGITVNADGLLILEGAIEFGAAISVNFGVASGGVSAMAGLYFKIEASDAKLAGYFRLRGEVEALGIISVSIELYLEMRYEPGSGKCVGTATLSIEVDVCLFSVTIEITCTKKFAGAGDDPTFAQLMDVAPDATSADWEAYCLAFA